MNGGTLDVNGQTLTTGLLSGETGKVTNGAATPATLTLTNTGTQSYSSVIQDGLGTLALGKGGAGTQILVGAHTYTGGTTISGGTLQLGNVALAQDGSIFGNVVNNGVFAIANSFLPVTLNGNITGTGSLVKTGGGTLALNGNSSYSAGSTISTGLVVLGSGTALGSGNVTIANGSGIDLNGQTIANNFSSIAGVGSTGEGAFFNNSTPAGITGAIGGGVNPGSFTIGGTGDITLERATSPNAFTITKINTGTLTLGGSLDNAFAQVTVNDGTVIFAKASTAAVHAVGGANSLTLNNGTVRLAGTGGDQIFNNNITTINGGTFDLNGTSETLGRLFGSSGAGKITNDLVSSSSTLTVGGSNGTGSDFNGIIQDGAGGTGIVGITKIGTGTLSIGGTLDYTGATTVNGGTLTATSSITGTSALTIAAGARFILGGPGPAPAPFEEAGELSASGGAAAVPEPGSMGLLLAGALGFLSRRPKRLSRRVEKTDGSGLVS